jgi:excisionase family DNA binding protein
MATTATPDMMTANEVAAFLRLSPRTVRRLLRVGELPGVQVGRQWRVAAGELDARLLSSAAARHSNYRESRRSHAAG